MKTGMVQILPLQGLFNSGDGDKSTFEITASYIESSKPDFLDMYKLRDETYGINVANIGKQGNQRVMQIAWSPVMKLKNEDYFIDNATDDDFETMTTNIDYKVYLGYNNQTLDLFSSLCQLEAADEF